MCLGFVCDCCGSEGSGLGFRDLGLRSVRLCKS